MEELFSKPMEHVSVSRLKLLPHSADDGTDNDPHDGSGVLEKF